MSGVAGYDYTGNTRYYSGAMPFEAFQEGPFHSSLNWHRVRMGKRRLSKEEIDEHLQGAGIGSTLLNIGTQLLPSLVGLLGAI